MILADFSAKAHIDFGAIAQRIPITAHIVGYLPRSSSRPSQSKRGVERLKLDASVLCSELLIGLGVFLVAIGLPSGDLTLEESLIRHPAIEALG
jgi:hypothetical protein